MKRSSIIVLGVLLLTLFSTFLTSMLLGSEKAAACDTYPSTVCKAEKIDVSGIGMQGLIPTPVGVSSPLFYIKGILPVPDTPTNKKVTLQLGAAPARTLPFPSDVKFQNDSTFPSVTGLRTPCDQWGFGQLYQNDLISSDGILGFVNVRAYGSKAALATVRAAVGYYPIATSHARFVSNYNTTCKFVWGGTSGTWIVVQNAPLIVTLPTATKAATTLTIKAVFMDNDNDSRPLKVKVQAMPNGPTSTTPSIFSSSPGNLLNIEPINLNVPAGTTGVEVTLLSPASVTSTLPGAGNVWPETGPKTQNGDSGMLLGATVSFPCNQ